MLQELGVNTAAEGEKADLCLINTCSVTYVADHKCRQAIHKMVRNNPGALMVVTGCYAQLEPEKVSGIEGVDLVLGSNEKADLIQFLNDAWIDKLAMGGVRRRQGRQQPSPPPLCQNKRHQVVREIMLKRKPYPLFPESTGRV